MNILYSVSLYALILKWTRFTLAILVLQIIYCWFNLDLFAINKENSFTTIPKAIHMNIFSLSLSKKRMRMKFFRIPAEVSQDVYKFWRFLPPIASRIYYSDNSLGAVINGPINLSSDVFNGSCQKCEFGNPICTLVIFLK